MKKVGIFFVFFFQAEDGIRYPLVTGVQTCALPIATTVPALSITLDDAITLTRTGDVWLFRGRKAADRAIRVATNSPINHVGMSVVIDDLPPLMWHAELGRSLPDLWSGTRHRGVQLHDLRDVAIVWATRYRQRTWLRQLDPPVSREMAVRADTGAQARRAGDKTGNRLLCRGPRRHLPGHGTACRQPPTQLVRRGPLLER